MKISGHAFILMDVLNVNYEQDDIHLNKRDAYSLIRQEIQSTYKGTLSPYHLKHMYFEFDKKNDMASYLSLSYQAMENVLQELDAVVKDESASFTISPQKVESPAKKSMINQQVSLANQVLKSPQADTQHVPEIVELDDFDTKETEVAKRQPLKRLKKTLFSPKAVEEENKQGIESHEEDSQASPKKNRGQPLGSKNNKKNPAVNNVVHKHNVPTKKGETS
jgi:hypothetical protein